MGLLIKRIIDVGLGLPVYRKPTHTNKCLDIDSYKPIAQEIKTTTTLVHRTTIRIVVRNLNKTKLWPCEIHWKSRNTDKIDLINVSKLFKEKKDRIQRNLQQISIQLYRTIQINFVPLFKRSKLCNATDKGEITDKNGVIYMRNATKNTLEKLEKNVGNE